MSQEIFAGGITGARSLQAETATGGWIGGGLGQKAGVVSLAGQGERSWKGLEVWSGSVREGQRRESLRVLVSQGGPLGQTG